MSHIRGLAKGPVREKVDLAEVTHVGSNPAFFSHPNLQDFPRFKYMVDIDHKGQGDQLT